MSIYLGAEKVSQATGSRSSGGGDLSDYYNKSQIDSIIDNIDRSVEAVNNKILQSDWNQDDNTKMDFIKNKPTINTSTVLTNFEIDRILQ